MNGRAPLCPNLNHRNASAPVGYCPQCGSVVNDRNRRPTCSEAAHADSRRRQNMFCVDCGFRLRPDPDAPRRG